MVTFEDIQTKTLTKTFEGSSIAPLTTGIVTATVTVINCGNCKYACLWPKGILLDFETLGI